MPKTAQTSAYSLPLSFKSSQNEEYDRPKLREDIKKDTLEIAESSNKFLKEIEKRDNAAKNKNELFELAISTIPPARRIEGILNEKESGEKAKAIGLAALAAINLPMDINDIKNTVKEIKTKTPNIDYKNSTTEFTFAKDTLLEPVLKKVKEKNPEKFGEFFEKYDKSMFNTKLGEKIRKLLNINVEKVENVVINKNKTFNSDVIYQLSGSRGAQFIGRAMLRVPVISAAIFGLLEIPNIVHAVQKENNTDKKLKAGGAQVLKSSINLTSMITGMAVAGAFLSKRLGGLGSLVGIGIGTYAGNKISNAINEKIFDSKDKE